MKVETSDEKKMLLQLLLPVILDLCFGALTSMFIFLFPLSFFQLCRRFKC